LRYTNTLTYLLTYLLNVTVTGGKFFFRLQMQATRSRKHSESPDSGTKRARNIFTVYLLFVEFFTQTI